MASRATIWRANQLRYTHHILHNAGARPLIHGSPLRSFRDPVNVPEGIRTPDPRLRRPLLYPAELQTQKAGDGNRTHISSLEGWCSTTELHPHMTNSVFNCSLEIGVTGFEPATSWSQTRRSSQADPHPVLEAFPKRKTDFTKT